MKSTFKGLGLFAVAATFSLTSCSNSSSSTTSTNDSSSSATSTTTPADTTPMTPSTPDTTAGTAAANTAPAPAMSDSQFVYKAVAANIAEVAAHKAALTHAVSKDVKMHAQHMLTDHEKLGADMKAYAKKKGYAIPTEGPADKKQMLDDMNKNDKGKDWDMAYLNAQENDHNEAIALFQSGESSVQDPELKSMIAKAIPQLQMHLQMVKDAKAAASK